MVAITGEFVAKLLTATSPNILWATFSHAILLVPHNFFGNVAIIMPVI